MTRSPVMIVFSIEPLGTSLFAMINVFSTNAMSAADTMILTHSRISFNQPPDGCCSSLRERFFWLFTGSACGTSVSFCVLPVLIASLRSSCAIFCASSSAVCISFPENASASFPAVPGAAVCSLAEKLSAFFYAASAGSAAVVPFSAKACLFSACFRRSGSPAQCCPARMPSSPPRSGSLFVLSSLMK